MGQILGRFRWDNKFYLLRIWFSHFFLVYLLRAIYVLVNMGIYPHSFYIFKSLI